MFQWEPKGLLSRYFTRTELLASHPQVQPGVFSEAWPALRVRASAQPGLRCPPEPMLTASQARGAGTCVHHAPGSSGQAAAPQHARPSACAGTGVLSRHLPWTCGGPVRFWFLGDKCQNVGQAPRSKLSERTSRGRSRATWRPRSLLESPEPSAQGPHLQSGSSAGQETPTWCPQLLPVTSEGAAAPRRRLRTKETDLSYNHTGTEGGLPPSWPRGGGGARPWASLRLCRRFPLHQERLGQPRPPAQRSGLRPCPADAHAVFSP